MANETTGTPFLIKGEDVDFIIKTPIVLPYDSEHASYKGFNYRIYAFGKYAFSVHENDDFHQMFDKGEVKTVMCTMSDDQLSFNKAVSWAQANNRKMRQAQHDAISVENFVLGKQLQPNEIL